MASVVVPSDSIISEMSQATEIYNYSASPDTLDTIK